MLAPPSTRACIPAALQPPRKTTTPPTTTTAAFVPLVIRSAGNPHFLARVASSRALAALVPPAEAPGVIGELLNGLPKGGGAGAATASSAAEGSHNHLHGEGEIHTFGCFLRLRLAWLLASSLPLLASWGA